MHIEIKSKDFNQAKDAAKSITDALFDHYSFSKVTSSKEGENHVISLTLNGDPTP